MKSGGMMALIIIPDSKMWTLMVWIFQLQSSSHQAVIYASLVIAAIPTMAVFALDVIQLRSARAPESLPSFQAGALIAEAKHFTAFITLSLLGLGGWKTAGDLGKEAKSSGAKGRSSELVGMPKVKKGPAGSGE